jgi:tRNA(adenine34) deaminase
MPDHESFMRLAIEEALSAKAEGNPPFGSVIVENGKVISSGRNLLTSSCDPTAHAETVAIRNAATAQRRSNFSNCTLYATSEPCPMCLSATLATGFTTLVIGARRNPSDRRWGAYTVEKFIAAPFFNNPITVVRDVLGQECTDIRDGAG